MAENVEEPGVLSTVVLSGVIVDVCIDSVLCLIKQFTAIDEYFFIPSVWRHLYLSHPGVS